jgi:hypothetical protein
MFDCAGAAGAAAAEAVFFVYVVTIEGDTFLGNNEHFWNITSLNNGM